MEKKRLELILAVVLLLAANILLLLTKYMERAHWPDLAPRGLETIVLPGILGVAVRGVKGMRWRPWLWMAVIAVAGTIAELAIWNFLSGMVPNTWLMSIQASLILTVGQLTLGVLMIIALSLLLYKVISRDGRTGLRTFGRFELLLCVVLLIAMFTAAMLAEWYEGVDYLSYMKQLGSGDAMALFTMMVEMGSSPAVILARAVYRGCRLLLKALCIWILVCGVLGFGGRREKR